MSLTTIKTLSEKFILFLLLLFVFILPFKFTVPAMLPDSSIFPLNTDEWIFENWSSSLFPAVSLCFIILLTLLTLIRKKELPLTYLIVPTLWVILAYLSLLGFINASCMDFPILQTSYIFGLAAFAITLMLALKGFINPKVLIGVMVLSFFLIILYGYYQYFIGFNETRAFFQNLQKTTNMTVSPDFLQRLSENQVFATFVISNNFAGFLILMIPLCASYLYMLFTVNLRLSRTIFTFLISAVLIWMLYLTGSRSAILSLFASILIVLICVSSLNRKSIIAAAVVFAAAIFSVFFLLSKGTASILVRLDYLKTSLILMKEHLWTGSGWGSFFHSYPYLKTYITGEAPNDPHNFLLMTGSQAGIPAMLILLVIFILPLILSIKKIRTMPQPERLTSYDVPILTGYLAWILHSLSDMNFQIPASASYAVIFMAFILRDNYPFKSVKNLKFSNPLLIIITLSCAAMILKHAPDRIQGELYMTKLYQTAYGQYYEPEASSSESNKGKRVLYNFRKANFYMPYSPFPFAAYAHYKQQQKEYAQAQQAMEKAISLSPERASFYYSLALIYSKEGNRDGFIENMRKAADLFPYMYKNSYDKALLNYAER